MIQLLIFSHTTVVIIMSDRTALHHLVMKEYATTDMICKLFDIYPKAAGIADKDQKCPLHYGLCNERLVRQAGFESILLILARRCEEEGNDGVCPASVVDKRTMTALHHLITKEYATTDMIRTLFDIYPEAVTIEDKNGRVPIHYAPLCNEQLVKKPDFQPILVSFYSISPIPRSLLGNEHISKIFKHS